MHYLRRGSELFSVCVICLTKRFVRYISNRKLSSTDYKNENKKFLDSDERREARSPATALIPPATARTPAFLKIPSAKACPKQDQESAKSEITESREQGTDRGGDDREPARSMAAQAKEIQYLFVCDHDYDGE